MVGRGTPCRKKPRGQAGERQRDAGAAALVTAAVALALVAGTAASSQAAVFRRIASGTIAFASDGSRYVAWQTRTGGPVSVLDTRRRRLGTVTVAAGCTLADERTHAPQGQPAGGGRFILECGAQQALLDARTGATTALLRPIDWETVGDLYVEGQAENGSTCVQSAAELQVAEPCIALYDISTRTVSQRPAFQPADLNRPGAPPVCARLRKQLVTERLYSLAPLFAYGEEMIAHRSKRGTVELQHCHGRPTALRDVGEPTHFEIRDGIVTWDTGHDAEHVNLEEDLSRGKLYRYDVQAHRLQTWQLPRRAVTTGAQPPPVGVFGYAAHTKAALFWIAPEDLIGSKLPTVDKSAVYELALR